MRSLQQFTPLMLIAMLFMSCSQSDENKSPETKEPVVITEDISYSVDDFNMNGYIAYDSNSTEKRPGILVVHEWWGHNEHARNRADMLAKAGYVAFAVDMYGDGQTADHPEDAQKFAMSVMGDMDAATARFNSALELLKANPMVDAEKIGAIGFCFGGSIIITMANAGNEDLDAVAAFHAGVQVPVMPEKDVTKARVLVMNGADDPFISAESIEAMQAAMDNAEVDYEYVAYEGVVHSFTNLAADQNGEKFELPLAYNYEADKDSWERMTTFFSETFKN